MLHGVSTADRARFAVPRVGILAALEQELEAVVGDFDVRSTERIVSRTFHRGVLHGHEAVAVVSGIGKTAVATTTTLLIQHFGARAILLIGVAGRVSEELSVGDVVVATHLVHHDLDASPIFPRYHVPTLGVARLATDELVSTLASAAARDFIAADGQRAKVAEGLVLSGDQFLGPAQIGDLRGRFPDGLAVEMEGAAVAQVCIEAGTPYAVVRSISDDGDAVGFELFLNRESGRYARGIVSRLLAALP
jgi:adenosylhomocysteine nucleosidase